MTDRAGRRARWSLATRAVVALAAVIAIGVPVVLASLDGRDRTSPSSRGGGGGGGDGGGGGAATVGPFDPEAPLDLSGVASVSADQQAAAEDLVRVVLAAEPGLPTFEEAPSRGYVSIGDDFTGEEHLLDWSAVLDPATLDPAHPEGLVFEVGDDGARNLVAVMFVAPPGSRIDDAPAPGGDLTRWHLHGHLCVDPGRTPPAVTASTDATGSCPDGLVEQRPSPAMHVWVTAHPCGPFSDLEGVGTEPGAVGRGCTRHRHG